MKLIAQVLAYEEADCIAAAINPWINACEHISLYEGSFQTLRNLGYPARSQDGTVEICQALKSANSNISLTFHDDINEPVLRNRHMWETCRDFGREDTVLFILDADEVYTDEEVAKCVNQVQSELDQFNTFWVSMNNFITDNTHFYKGFRVPRFFRLKTARGFSGYNDVCFQEGVIPTDIRGVLPKHMSWCPVEKARRKIEWQTTALNWNCSFKIENNKVVLNEEYYQQTGKEKPIIHSL